MNCLRKGCDIVGMIESGALENEGAAFGALLHIGDPRACKLIWPLRETLDENALNQAINCQTGFMYACTVDFYIDWLEGLEGDIQDRQYPKLAAGLALLKRRATNENVYTSERPFPFTSVTKKEFQAATKSILLAEYLKRIAPRLYALERAEPPPRIMPHVLLEWGLQPKTDPSETAVLDDRRQNPAQVQPTVGTNIPDGQVASVKEEWFDGQGSMSMIWGILNPNGPTLYCLGYKSVNGKQRVFFRWLHMLGGCTTFASKSESDGVTYQGIFDGALEIHNHLLEQGQKGIIVDVPYFLMVNRTDPTLIDIAKRLLTITTADSDWGRHLAYLRAFGSNFFGRAGCEIRSYYEAEKAKALSESRDPSEFLKFVELRYGHLPDFRDAIIPKFESSQLTAALLDEWWLRVSDVEFRKSAIGTLGAMWNGAISVVDDEMKQRTIPFEKIKELLIGYMFDYLT
jgi:hypothetical protein